MWAATAKAGASDETRRSAGDPGSCGTWHRERAQRPDLDAFASQLGNQASHRVTARDEPFDPDMRRELHDLPTPLPQRNSKSRG